MSLSQKSKKEKNKNAVKDIIWNKLLPQNEKGPIQPIAYDKNEEVASPMKPPNAKINQKIIKLAVSEFKPRNQLFFMLGILCLQLLKCQNKKVRFIGYNTSSLKQSGTNSLHDSCKKSQCQKKCSKIWLKQGI
ncbi:UNKNOWN [Stylonychia lemnae]|uniref:Uncharacterized protein n=1 Tax=Stylonychia lemnae TaxID=5949 RepID=A0A078AWY1_STYLE|nr:UNKNOWN [Stylonychia lemnae]|eukprot:CDW86674.1 UNKNOWN [Stylonychia lemnae]